MFTFSYFSIILIDKNELELVYVSKISLFKSIDLSWDRCEIFLVTQIDANSIYYIRLLTYFALFCAFPCR